MKRLTTCFIFIFASTSFSGTGEDSTKYQYLNPEKNYPSSHGDSDSPVNESGFESKKNECSDEEYESELKAYAILNDTLPQNYRVNFDFNEISEGESDDEEIKKSLDKLRALLTVNEKDEILATEGKSDQTSSIEQSESSTISIIMRAVKYIREGHRKLNMGDQNKSWPDNNHQQVPADKKASLTVDTEVT